MSERRAPIVLRYLGPPIGLALIVWAAPLAYALALSFTDAGPGGAGRLIGLSNYLRLLGDPLFGRAILASLLFACGAVVLQVGLGFGLALTALESPRRKLLVTLLLLVPWTLSDIAVALVWHEFLGEEGGLLNWLLTQLSLGPLPWKTHAGFAFGALWIATLWHGLALSALLQLAGLASLPNHLLAAARLDGASRLMMLRHILLPHQRRMLGANALLVWMGAMVSFTLPFALTGGGPLRATELVALFTYRTAFGGRMELGYASALGMAILALYAVFAAMYLRLRRPA